MKKCLIAVLLVGLNAATLWGATKNELISAQIRNGSFESKPRPWRLFKNAYEGQINVVQSTKKKKAFEGKSYLEVEAINGGGKFWLRLNQTIKQQLRLNGSKYKTSFAIRSPDLKGFSEVKYSLVFWEEGNTKPLKIHAARPKKISKAHQWQEFNDIITIKEAGVADRVEFRVIFVTRGKGEEGTVLTIDIDDVQLSMVK
jgi:hypothetical protein